MHQLKDRLSEWIRKQDTVYVIDKKFTLSIKTYIKSKWICNVTTLFMHMCVCSATSDLSNSATPWTVAHQAPLSMGFSRQEYWRGLPCPPPWDLPNPGIEPRSLMSPALAGQFFTTSATGEALYMHISSVQSLSRVQLFATPWAAARQASLSIVLFVKPYSNSIPFKFLSCIMILETRGLSFSYTALTFEIILANLVPLPIPMICRRAYQVSWKNMLRF